MDLTAPDWLTKREGTLQKGSDQQTWHVVLGLQSQYSLTAVPVKGKFGCSILQTTSGQRITSSGTFDKPDEALRGGLEDLRKHLGW